MWQFELKLWRFLVKNFWAGFGFKSGGFWFWLIRKLALNWKQQTRESTGTGNDHGRFTWKKYCQTFARDQKASRNTSLVTNSQHSTELKTIQNSSTNSTFWCIWMFAKATLQIRRKETNAKPFGPCFNTVLAIVTIDDRTNTSFS